MDLTRMTEATRLTREGRLDEAMALLQGGPMPGAAPASAKVPAPKGEVLDLIPPKAPGGAWSEAAPAPRPRAEAARAEPRPASVAEPRPDSLAARLKQGLAGLDAHLPGGLASGLAGALPGGLAGTLPGGLGALRPGLGGQAVPVPDGARWEARAVDTPSGRRAYRLYVPASSPEGPLPLIVMLHGCTQSPEDFALGTRMNEVAEEMGFLVAYPEQTQSANAQRCWNWFEPGSQGRGGEPALIAAMIRDAGAAHEVDPDRVTVAGLSAGGAQAAIMGAAWPDLIAGVGVHSGLACGAARDVGSAFAAMRQGAPGVALAAPVPTISFHGDRDATVALANGAAVIAQAGAGARLAVEATEGTSPGGQRFSREVHRDAGGRAILESWTLHGAGHAWSGGSPDGSYTDPAGPDASRAMARFLLAQRRRPA